jgi:glycosyltransferase involved in cell wall biosynthesis
MRKHRIGFISTMDGAPWGGSEELWSRTAACLRADGWEVGVNYEFWNEMSVPLRALAAAGCEVTLRKTNLRWQRLLGNTYRRRRFTWLDRFKPDFVLLNLDYQSNGLDWMQECRKRNIPYALLVHAVLEHLWPADAKNLALSEAYSRAAAVYFVSHGNAKFVRTQLANPLAEAKIVRNPVNVAFDAAPPWPQENGTFKLACVGRVHPPAKGQDILFDVLSQDKWKKRPLKVTLFGKGQSEETLQKLKAMYGLENVMLNGFVSDVEAIWAEHHALVLPSRYEGLPIVIVEAMLCGRPCIVTDVAGNAELIEDGVTGFVAPAPKASLLDETMERAWQNRRHWHSMGAAAAAHVRQVIPRDPVGVFAKELVGLLEPSASDRPTRSQTVVPVTVPA